MGHVDDNHRGETAHIEENRYDTRSITSSHEEADQEEMGGVDALATVVPAEGADGHSYGGSSTVAFVQQAIKDYKLSQQITNKAMARRGRSLTMEHNAASSLNRLSQTPEMVREPDETAAVYPSRALSDDYTRCFWEFIHPLFPIRHRPSFMVRYERLWSTQTDNMPQTCNTKVDESIFVSILNLVFALGCQFSIHISPSRRASVASGFYERSRRLFVYDVMDTVSFPAVQMLLLTGVYLQSTRHADRCWNAIGLAIRAAQTLGLH